MSAGVAGAAGEHPLLSFSPDVARFWPPRFFWTVPKVDLGKLIRDNYEFTIDDTQIS